LEERRRRQGKKGGHQAAERKSQRNRVQLKKAALSSASMIAFMPPIGAPHRE
jgi:hypothetical protein